jgi:adenine-specific DNA-methyltransferase
MAKQNYKKLELTWIGKGEEPKLEPRILIENPEYSYGDARSENMLIHGDNLLALKALEQDFTGKIKCIYIDPPYNTGNAFEHYDDGIEHSLWLSLMRDRIIILRNLLSVDGSIWITLDENEVHYFKVVCDEIFGRNCFVTTVIWKTSDNSNNNVTQFSLDHNQILVYGKKPMWKPKFLQDLSKRTHFKNPDNDPKGPWFDGNPVNNPGLRANLQYNITSPSGKLIKHPPNGWRWSWETIQEKLKSGEIRFSADEKRIIRRTYLKDMEGLPPSSIWNDIEETGHNRQAKYELKNLFPDVPVTSLLRTPKPEKLIQKVLELSTEESDLVLDSFLGSGTTTAVAHKMGRRWIGIELGEHAKTHCYPRLKAVVDGEQGGISKATDWKGSGGFKFYNLAPSLLNEDKYGNWIISKEYNAQMLASAVAKQEGFKYEPDEHVYWKQGMSSEKDFIFTTTQFITAELLDKIHEEMQPGESLLIACKCYQDGCENRHANISIKKIPHMLMGRCEFGKDDYSFNIVNMPLDEDAESWEEPEIETTSKKSINIDSTPGLLD